MTFWRVTFPLLVQSIGLVILFVMGIVILAVSIEKADQEPSVLWDALRFQVLAALIWLSPLMTALGVCLACLRQRRNGAQRALACSGIGLMHLAPIVITIGLVVGLAGLAGGEWLIPRFADSDMPGWVWTASGSVRTTDGLLVPANLQGDLQHVEHLTIGDAYPRLASFGSLMMQSGATAMTERWARAARVLACVGFGLLGLLFCRFRQPMIWVMAVCGALTLMEALGWVLGSQNQLLPPIAGSFAAWGWLVPGMWAWCYSSTRNQ